MAEWSKVLTAVPLPFMVWSTLGLDTYHLRFVSWVFHVIFSFVHFISLDTLGGLHAFRKPLPYNMYLFNLRIANHILMIKIFKKKKSLYPHTFPKLPLPWFTVPCFIFIYLLTLTIAIDLMTLFKEKGYFNKLHNCILKK